MELAAALCGSNTEAKFLASHHIDLAPKRVISIVEKCITQMLLRFLLSST